MALDKMFLKADSLLLKDFLLVWENYLRYVLW